MASQNISSECVSDWSDENDLSVKRNLKVVMKSVKKQKRIEEDESFCL